MMRGIRRLAVVTVATGLLAVAAVGVNIETVHAQTEAASCTGAADNSTPWQCDIEVSTPSTSAIQVTATDNTGTTNEEVDVQVTSLSCTYNADTEPDTTPGGEQAETPFTYDVPDLPLTAETGTCVIDVTATTPTSNSSGAITPDPFTVEVLYTPIATASSSTTAASTVEPVTGYDNMCVDDKSNSSSNGAKIIVWECNSSDEAQSWNWTDNELRHNGKCINDTGDGGSGTKLILYTCSSAKNDKWTKSNGELKLQAHNQKLCLDDNGYSTTDGTQLIVYTCKDQANEKWTVSS